MVALLSDKALVFNRMSGHLQDYWEVEMKKKSPPSFHAFGYGRSLCL